MHKTLTFLLAILAASFVYGQTDSLTREERLALDSMFKNDEFIKMMMGKKKNYFDISIGVSNSVFSTNNNAFNAEQSETKRIYYTPSVGYYFKSGLAIAMTGYIANDEGELKIYQYAINPSYTYDNKNITGGISYTRFIEGSAASFDISPFKNDLYANIKYKKTWIEPGLAVGFAFGKIKEQLDSASWDTSGTRVILTRKEIITRIKGFSVTLSASHKWTFNKILNKKDAIQIQPVLYLNASSQSWKTSYSNFRPVVQAILKRRYGDGGASSFKVQSLGFLADITYYYGKFYFQPQLYLDYYLPSTTEKRLTTLFSAVAGFSF